MTINVNGAVTRECSISVPQSYYDFGVISLSELNASASGNVISEKTVPIDIKCRGDFNLKIKTFSDDARLDDGGCLIASRGSFHSPVSICALSPDKEPFELYLEPSVWKDSGTGTRNFTFILKKYSTTSASVIESFRAGHYDIGFDLTIEPI
ncbi:hypothetical protein [Enterobacter wuhouensis]|uniref:hypothetical protein n=1 Tax=Enterobacter wuhouensis TaxID=2529381 RepID=UPI003D7815EC